MAASKLASTVCCQPKSLRGCRHARSPQRVARTAGKSHSRLHFAHSTHTISAEGCARSRQITLSPAFRALDTHDLRRGLLQGQIALSPVFRALDTHHLRRGLKGLRTQPANRTLACISRARHARSPQRVKRTAGKSHSRLYFAHSTARSPQRAERVAHAASKSHSRLRFARSTRDLRRGLRAQPANRTLACILRTRRARSPQRVARAAGKSHSRARSTRTISAEGCARTGQIALSPAFRALDTHDLGRGLRGRPANRTLACIFRALDTHDLRGGLRADRTNRALACISRTRHARSPQRVALSVDAVRPALRL